MSLLPTPQTLTVVARAAGRTAVWAMATESVDASAGQVPLTGAWVFADGDPRIAAVTTGTLTIAIDGDPARVARELAEHITAELALITAAHVAAYQARPKNRAGNPQPKMADPVWPDIMVTNPTVTIDDEPARTALTVARQVSTLLGAWGSLEAERLRVHALHAAVAERDPELIGHVAGWLAVLGQPSRPTPPTWLPGSAGDNHAPLT